MHIPNWEPVYRSFVCMFISPLCIASFSLQSSCVFCYVDEAKSANHHENKRIISWRPFWNRLFKYFLTNFLGRYTSYDTIGGVLQPLNFPKLNYHELCEVRMKSEAFMLNIFKMDTKKHSSVVSTNSQTNAKDHCFALKHISVCQCPM